MFNNAFDAIAAQHIGGPIAESMANERMTRRRRRSEKTTFTSPRGPRPNVAS